jgi:site-specific DNA recombinase
VLAEQARAGSDNTSWRLQRFQAYNRRKGIWKRPRPFGYLVVNGKLRPHPIEASIVRCMVDEFLDGASLRGIAHRLNESGVRAPRAVRAAEARAAGRVVKDPPTEEWSYVSVREILIAPSLTAIQAHDRGLFCDDNGELVSVGEGIVTLGKRARILAEFERRTALVRSAQDPSRIGQRTGGGRPPKYLFSGWIRCGECGAASTWAIAINKEKNKYGRYVCSRQWQGKTCRGCGVQADALEGEVIRRFTLKLSTLEPGDPLLERIAERWLEHTLPEGETERRVLRQAIDDVEARLTDLYDARYLRHEFPESADLERYEVIRASLLEQRAAARAGLARLGPRAQMDIGALLDTEMTREARAVSPLHRQRSLLQLAIQQVWIYNADHGRVPLADRVGIVWVGEDPPTPRNVQRSGDD